MTPARYPGRCCCGAWFRAGDPVTFGQGFTVNGRVAIQFCPTCRPVSRRSGPGIEVLDGAAVVTVFEMRDVATGQLRAYQLRRDGSFDAPDWANIHPDTFTVTTSAAWSTPYTPERARAIVGAAYLFGAA